MKLKKAALKAVGKIVNKVTSSTVQGTSAGVKSGYTADSELIALCRRIGAESVVMLKNNGNVLPLDRSRKVSVFGRVQNDYFYVGYGSGGDVNAPYKISLMQALRNDPDITVNTELADEYEHRCAAEPVDNGFWGHWPMCYDELSIDAATVKKAAANSDTAIVVIGRAAGEDRENKLEKGSYYLTDEETALLDSVTAEFDKVIVLLNCGSIMDMAALDAYGDKISALLYVWQSGMESGNALADVLSGRVSPSGKLTDTIARDYYDYPSAKDFGGKDYNFYTEDIYVGYRWFETFAKNRVLYPFGFGLSYTDFTIDNAEFFCGDASDVAKKLAQENLRPDVITVDPPRKGLAEDVVESIARMQPERVVYVSCDSATMARDVKRFAALGYRAVRACAVDLFPRADHVETVVLLSKGEVDSKKIRVEFSLEDMDMSEFQDGATYAQLKDYVLEHSGLKVSNLYISQIKRKCGIGVGKNYNLPKSEDSRQPQCPPEKEKAIREAFKYFGII